MYIRVRRVKVKRASGEQVVMVRAYLARSYRMRGNSLGNGPPRQESHYLSQIAESEIGDLAARAHFWHAVRDDINTSAYAFGVDGILSIYSLRQPSRQEVVDKVWQDAKAKIAPIVPYVPVAERDALAVAHLEAKVAEWERQIKKARQTIKDIQRGKVHPYPGR